jgi:Protein of unknown function (DUF1015)
VRERRERRLRPPFSL